MHLEQVDFQVIFVECEYLMLSLTLFSAVYNIGNNMGNTMGNMGSNMGNNMGSNMGNTMGNSLGNNMANAMGNTLGNNMGNTMGGALGNPLGNMGMAGTAAQGTSTLALPLQQQLAGQANYSGLLNANQMNAFGQQRQQPPPQ